MAKIKIKDLTKEQKISSEEMKAIRGGIIGDMGMPRFSYVSISPVPLLRTGLTPENDRLLPGSLRGVLPRPLPSIRNRA